jgi:hypothetical protein
VASEAIAQDDLDGTTSSALEVKEVSMGSLTIGEVARRE